MIKIKKGLDLPISGAPQQTRMKTHVAKQVAIVGADFPGLKPTLLVAVGDNVQQGPVLQEQDPEVKQRPVQEEAEQSISRCTLQIQKLHPASSFNKLRGQIA